MAFELVYTSVPKGLKPGSYGFCTVACSKELPESVVSTLEKISGYRRVSQSNAPGANPVVYSHMLLSAQGGSRRVVSRISDAGVDYTSRDNKIACHYVLEQRDLCKAGPAALVAQPGLFAERWTEGPRQFEGSITFPPTPEIAPTCDEWSKVLGDPGWAGALAATTYSARAALLIVEPSCNVLRLFQEAIALLPPELRWNQTFSTYFTKSLPGVRCQWKAVIKGSPEESIFRVLPDLFIIDLTNPDRAPAVETYARSTVAANLVAIARSAGKVSAAPTWSAPPATPPTAPETALNTEASGKQPVPLSFERASGYPAQFPSASSNRPPVFDPAVPLKISRDSFIDRDQEEYASEGLQTNKTFRAILRYSLWVGLGGLAAALLTTLILTCMGRSPLKSVAKLLNNRNEVQESARPEQTQNPSAEKIFPVDGEENDRKADDLWSLPPEKKTEKPEPRRRPDGGSARPKENAPRGRGSNSKSGAADNPFAQIPEGGLGGPRKTKENGGSEGSSAVGRGDNKRPDSTGKTTADKTTAGQTTAGKATASQTTSGKITAGKEENESDDKAQGRRTAVPTTYTSVLSNSEKRALEKFIESFNVGEAAVDFDRFDETARSLRSELAGTVQDELNDVWAVCEKYGATIEITCSIEGDAARKGRFVGEERRLLTKKVDFAPKEEDASDELEDPFVFTDDQTPSPSEPEQVKKVAFNVESAEGTGDSGSLTLEFNNYGGSSGLLSFVASSELARDYFLAASKFKWTVTIPSKAKSDGKEVFATDFVQLLKPRRFKNDASIQLDVCNELAAVIGGDRPHPSLETVDTLGRSDKDYAYVLLFNPSSQSNQEKAEALAVDRSTVDYVLRMRLSSYDTVDFMTFRFTRSTNGRVLKCVKYVDEIQLENELNDFYRNEERRSYVNVGSGSVFSSPSETDLETETEKKVEIAMRTIRKFIDSDHSFRLYLAPTKGGGRRSPDSWILLGETTFSAASEPVTETKRRR